MTIPTEPIGSIPRPLRLGEAFAETGVDDTKLQPLYDEAIGDTVERFAATGSPGITDGDRREYHNFGAYCVDGLTNMAPKGLKLPFLHHRRRWPRLTQGPFRYNRYADAILKFTQEQTDVRDATA